MVAGTAGRCVQPVMFLYLTPASLERTEITEIEFFFAMACQGLIRILLSRILIKKLCDSVVSVRDFLSLLW